LGSVQQDKNTTHTHTHTHSLSLSLSLTHTHARTYTDGGEQPAAGRRGADSGVSIGNGEGEGNSGGGGGGGGGGGEDLADWEPDQPLTDSYKIALRTGSEGDLRFAEVDMRGNAGSAGSTGNAGNAGFVHGLAREIMASPSTVPRPAKVWWRGIRSRR